MQFQCAACGKTYPLAGLEYECACGGLFQMQRKSEEKIEISVSLGEMKTPILSRNLGGLDVLLKLDYLMPTGSFKDRGAFIMINALKKLGITEVVEDSSGNAGAAIAGYCAAAGIQCHIYLPESTSAGKIKQISAYGASIVKVPGTRHDTAQAILKAAQTTYYASHVYNPLFFEGTKSLAHEIYEQVGFPDYVVVPVGNGTMLLGLYLGFKELGKLPRLIAVQSNHCAPVYHKWNDTVMGEAQSTVAEGIAVQSPKRIDEMLAAIRESKGEVVLVEDECVLKAQAMLGALGIYVEATSGTAIAGAQQYFANLPTASATRIVIPLTGSGLKK